VSQVRDEPDYEQLLADDDQLLAALREAILAREAVPSCFVEMGKNAYAWHNIDAELAQLTYDSSTDREPVTAVRSEAASIRALTFTSAHLSIELEVAESLLLGQIVPPQAGTLEIQTRSGTAATTPIDEIGCFAVDPIPASPFRLRCRTADGTDVLTGWITLLPGQHRANLGPPNLGDLCINYPVGSSVVHPSPRAPGEPADS
jgi:hypothetical protein